MSTVSAADVYALRARTGVSILACKQALEEANGDQEKAIEILRKRGIAQAVKKADREQSEGGIFISTDGEKAAIVTLKCETDFVARNDAFIALGQELADAFLKKGDAAAKTLAEQKMPEAIQKLGENISLGSMEEVISHSVATYVHSNRKIGVVVGSSSAEATVREKLKDVAMHAAALNPLYVRPDEVPTAVIEKEREIWKDQLKNEKKPEAILEKIMLGKEKKFREENALLKQAFVKDPNQTIEQYLGGADVSAYVRVTV
jgi:elongation factor Ts